MHSDVRAHGTTQQVVTDYCPLDLFSGDERRITKAIYALWDSWVASKASVNNLKVFASGKFVTPSESHLLLAKGYNDEQDLNTIRDAFAAALVRPLLRTPLLHTLSKLQRNLDVLDIEGLSKLWRLAESSSSLYRMTFSSFFEQRLGGSGPEPPATPIGVNSPFLQVSEPDISDWINFLDTYLAPNKPEMDHSNPSPENLRYYLLAYLLSATFKDCSIIVKLDFLQLGGLQLDDKLDPVTVIDLDPKSMGKLRQWEKLDQEIARTYSSMQKKVCVDESQTMN
jgi:inositol-pentakisphosphate 2-kinase